MRWAEQVGELTADIDALPTQTLLASAFIVYLPSASEDGRKERLRHWQEITKVLYQHSLIRILTLTDCAI